MRRILTAILLGWGMFAGEVLAADRVLGVGEEFRFSFRCRWTDYYDSISYTATLDPGMAIVAAPSSRLDVAIEMARPADTSVDHTIAVQMTPSFDQVGGYVVRRNGELALMLPDTGGSFPMLLTYRPTPRSPADTLTLTVLVPKAIRFQRSRINGYLIGQYPPPAGGRSIPDRFVEIWPELMELHLSSQFHIHDFVSNSRTDDQRRFFPKYAVIRYSLIQKVEKLVTLIDRSPNFQCKGIRVLSGYRTPDYNHAVPEAAYNSYHQYGLAADIIVDSNPADGEFDDLNQDGKVNIYDAANLAQICDYLENAGAIEPGGIGLYEYKHRLPGGKYYTSYHIHVDVRPKDAKRTRWGYEFQDGRRVARLVWRK